MFKALFKTEKKKKTETTNSRDMTDSMLKSYNKTAHNN